MLCSVKDAFYKPSSILTDLIDKQKNNDLAVSRYNEDTKNIIEEFKKNKSDDKKNEKSKAIKEHFVSDDLINSIINSLENNQLKSSSDFRNNDSNDLSLNNNIHDMDRYQKHVMNNFGRQYDIHCRDVASHLSICKVCDLYIKNLNKNDNMFNSDNLFDLNKNNSIIKIIFYVAIIFIIYKLLTK